MVAHAIPTLLTSTANDYAPVANGESNTATPQQATLVMNHDASQSSSSMAESASVTESQSQSHFQSHASVTEAAVAGDARNRKPC